MKIGSLFSGIGGLEMGLEWSGLGHTIWQCEMEPFAQTILRKHWSVPIYEDVRTIDETVERPNVICGGFPCQDISGAGNKVGIEGERSGLWKEMCRLIRLFRPELAIMENVSALTIRGLGTVLEDLAEVGYDSWWDCIPASALGAPHRRDRIFILAYPNGGEVQYNKGEDTEPRRPGSSDGHSRQSGIVSGGKGGTNSSQGQNTTNPYRLGFEEERETLGEHSEPDRCAGPRNPYIETPENPWEVEPDVGRVAHGVPDQLHRLKCLGNAVAPPVAYTIGLIAQDLLEWRSNKGLQATAVGV